MGIDGYIFMSILLFLIGAIGVIVRRNTFIVFMSIELMLNSANLAFIAFARYFGDMNGQVISMLIMGLAAAEAALGLAILIQVYRAKHSFDIDIFNLLKGK